MATTRIIPMHIIKGQAYTVHERIDYAMNPTKTRRGELVMAYGCDRATTAAEMLLSKRNYTAFTGMATTQKDVLLYQIRQSFKPGEITPEQAQEIGYELAIRFTKGSHQFIVATHIDQEHIHTHNIYNSTNIDSTHKFRDFLGSGRAVRKISDRLCLEHGLPIVENSKRGNKHYGKWLGDKKPLSYQEKLRLAIDEILSQKPAGFDAFLSAMQTAGFEIKQGKQFAFRAPGQQKFTRLSSLGDGYSEQEIRAVIADKTPLFPSRSKAARQEPQRVHLLVDIQAKGPGYERWAKIFNLKQMAQAMNFLTENNLLEYAELEEKATAAATRFNELSARIKAAETRMAEIGNLKAHIVNYSKTRDVYTTYRKAGYSKKFYEANASGILLHKAAKAAFDTLPGKKIPTIKTLQAEYEMLITEKKKAYSEYAVARKEMKELLTAKMNIDRLLGGVRKQPERKQEHHG